MSFLKLEEPFGAFTKLTVRHKESGNEITVIPNAGGRLNNFVVNLHGESVDVIDGYTDSVALAEETSLKGSFLAPFPNRIADGKYEFRGKKHQLPINKAEEKHASHGFVSDKAFEVISTEEIDDYYQVVLRQVSEGIDGYPFSFATELTYRFGGVWLEVATKVTNTEKESIPIGFGWHPYFRLTVPVNVLQLTLPPVEKIEVDERLIPTGKKSIYDKFEKPGYMADTEFNTSFHFLSDNKEIQLFDESHGLYLAISFMGKDNAYEYVKLHTMSDRKSLAIEPMTCAADAFNNDLGLKSLPSQQSLTGRFTIVVS